MKYLRDEKCLSSLEISELILGSDTEKISTLFLDVFVPSSSKKLEILECHKNGLDEFLVEVPLCPEDLVFPTQVIDLEMETGAPPIIKPHP